MVVRHPQQPDLLAAGPGVIFGGVHPTGPNQIGSHHGPAGHPCVAPVVAAPSSGVDHSVRPNGHRCPPTPHPARPLPLTPAIMAAPHAGFVGRAEHHTGIPGVIHNVPHLKLVGLIHGTDRLPACPKGRRGPGRLPRMVEVHLHPALLQGGDVEVDGGWAQRITHQIQALQGGDLQQWRHVRDLVVGEHQRLQLLEQREGLQAGDQVVLQVQEDEARESRQRGDVRKQVV